MSAIRDRHLLLVGFGLAVFYISMFSGKRIVKQQRKFERIEDSWSILIATYSEGYITKDYEPQANVFLPTLTLIPYEESKRINLSTVRIMEPKFEDPKMAKADEPKSIQTQALKEEAQQSGATAESSTPKGEAKLSETPTPEPSTKSDCK